MSAVGRMNAGEPCTSGEAGIPDRLENVLADGTTEPMPSLTSLDSRV